MIWTARAITEYLTAFQGPFEYRRQYVAVPNLAQTFSWEADLVVCSKAGWLTEVEVKISVSDWKQDKLKHKWTLLPDRGGWNRVRRFYYAAPMDLARRWEEFGIPDFAGVIGVGTRPTHYRGKVYGEENCHEILRPATDRPARKATEKEMVEMGRLASMRAWTLSYRAIFSEEFYSVAKRMLEAEGPEHLGDFREELEGIVKTYEARRPLIKAKAEA